jgi:hypothetical protein
MSSAPHAYAQYCMCSQLNAAVDELAGFAEARAKPISRSTVCIYVLFTCKPLLCCACPQVNAAVDELTGCAETCAKAI